MKECAYAGFSVGMLILIFITLLRIDKVTLENKEREEEIAADLKVVRAWIDAGGSNMSYEVDVFPEYKTEYTTQALEAMWNTDNSTRIQAHSRILQKEDEK